MMCRILRVVSLLMINAFVVNSQSYSPSVYEGQIFTTTYHIIHEDITNDKEQNKDWHDSIRKLFEDFDFSLSMFNPKSIISKMNNNDADARANHYVKNVIEKSLEVSRRTSGAFDITVAPLVNLWGFGFKNQDNVTPDAVDSIKQFVGYQKISLDIQGRLHKSDPRIQLDASSIAKGYMCDIIGEWLKNKGVNNYMVEIGGEIVVKGRSPKGKPWRVGINIPEDDQLQRINGIQGVLELSDGAIATSGNYRNFYYKDGKRYAHTIDPASGYPVQKNILSSTVIAPDCMTADAYATSFMVMGVEKAMDVLASDNSIMAYFIIADDNSTQKYKVVYSEGLKKMLKNIAVR